MSTAHVHIPLFAFPRDAVRVIDSAKVIEAFHGTLAETAHKIVSEQRMEPSTRDYDWLGHGVYFWCDYDHRAWEWARRAALRAEAEDGVPRACGVVKAAVRLGTCIDIHSHLFDQLIQDATNALLRQYAARQVEPPQNTERGAMRLSCATFNFLCKNLDVTVDTIRCPFHEGNELIPGSKIFDKVHIQLCARTPGSIRAIELVGIEPERRHA